MRSLCGSVARAALLVALAVPARGTDHLLFTEFAVTPTNGEFVEIYNPTAAPVDLSQYYLSDFVLAQDPAQNYWRIVDGALNPDPGFPNDFLVRFPVGASVLPGQTIVVALHDDLAFADAWSAGGQIVRPDFELIQDGSADGVSDMVDPGPELFGRPLIQSAAGLSNGTECVVLFHWDGVSDLVQDVDVVQWQAPGGTTNTIFPNKSGVSVDGPDPGTSTSIYLPDTPPASQNVASNLATANDFGLTVSRTDFDEAGETLTGGNGLTGHDETSEDLSLSWQANTTPSIGSPGEFGPPALLAGAARAVNRFDLLFSRGLDATTAERSSAYSLLQILTPGGEPVTLPLAATSAALAEDGRTVVLTTDPQVPLALYEIRVSGVLSEDGSESLALGTRALVRGFNPGPDLRLSIPHRPFFPQLDGRMEISYTAPQGASVLLRIFDGQGREILVMAEETAPPGGLRTIQWDGRDRLRQRVPAGVYYLHLEIPATGQATVVPLVMASAAEETFR